MLLYLDTLKKVCFHEKERVTHFNLTRFLFFKSSFFLDRDKCIFERHFVNIITQRIGASHALVLIVVPIGFI